MSPEINMRSLNLPINTDKAAEKWAAETLSNLSLSEKIGQLLHIASWSNRGEDHIAYILEMIEKYHIGGLIFFQGDPKTQADLTNQFQAATKVPLLISIDAEWGLGMRLEGAEPFPYQMTLGAIQDVSLIKKMGGAIARQLKRIGSTLNHAPVIDVNTNPENPVINFRAFGQNKEAVAERGIAYMEGLQEEHVLACGKHFPGHGDTSADSHKELPFLEQTKEQLWETELYPFRKLFEAGLGSVMIAHLQIPALEPLENHASTLSRNIVTGLLREEMGFEGLIITDAMDMKAVADHYAPGQADVEALLAGNDVLLFVRDVSKAVDEISKAVEQGRITEEEIDRRCCKQLVYKFWMGLNDFQPVGLAGLPEEVNLETYALNDELYKASTTLLSKNGDFPSDKEGGRVMILSLYANGDQPDTGALNHHTLLKGALGNKKTDIPLFAQQLLSFYTKITCTHEVLQFEEIETRGADLLTKMAEYDHVIVGIHDIKLKAPDNFGITKEMIDFLAKAFELVKVHLVFFGNAYALGKLRSLPAAASVVLAYQENKYTHKYAAEVLTGALTPVGKLPVAINQNWQSGHGL